MTISHVQSGTNQVAGAATSITVTLGSAVGSGNCVVGAVTRNDNEAVVTITDDKGNTYTNLDQVHDASTGYYVTSFVLGNIINGPVTITATFGGSEGFRTIAVDEYSGVSVVSNPNDGHAGQLQAAPGTGTDAVTSGAFTTTANGNLIWSCTTNAAGHAPSTGTGFNLRNSTFVLLFTEDKIQSSAGSIAGTWTQGVGSDNPVTLAVALKAATGGASSGDSAFQNGAMFLLLSHV